MATEQQLQKATFAAGCFWGVEETFRKVKGVKDTMVGYTGGLSAKPTYEDVCSDETGHAEAVEVMFDPSQISYGELLEIFWDSHNPTTMNKQGPDIGSQYRSVIFFHNTEQEEEAMQSKEEAGRLGKFGKPIVTEIVPAGEFYRAEEYHQQYLKKNGKGACHL